MKIVIVFSHLCSPPTALYAQLASKTISATTSGACVLKFWYCMYGTDTGVMIVFVATHFGKPDTPVWTKRGDLGMGWKRADVVLKNDKDFQVSQTWDWFSSVSYTHLTLPTKAKV